MWLLFVPYSLFRYPSAASHLFSRIFCAVWVVLQRPCLLAPTIAGHSKERAAASVIFKHLGGWQAPSVICYRATLPLFFPILLFAAAFSFGFALFHTVSAFFFFFAFGGFSGTANCCYVVFVNMTLSSTLSLSIPSPFFLSSLIRLQFLFQHSFIHPSI